MTKVGSALELIWTLDKRQKAVNKQVENMQEQIAAQAKETLKQGDDIRQNKAREKATAATIQEVLSRLEQLEQDRAGPKMWRQAAFDDEGMEGPRPPAMVMGGWSTNLEQDEVLQLARKFGEGAGPKDGPPHGSCGCAGESRQGVARH